jgi:hypothetical protein
MKRPKGVLEAVSKQKLSQFSPVKVGAAHQHLSEVNNATLHKRAYD